MKNIWVFLSGMVVGMMVLFGISNFFGNSSRPIESKNGINMFPEKGDCISDKQFQVFQVLDNGVALANEFSDKIGDSEFYSGITVLFVCKTKYYYDKEVIKVPDGKCVRQIGVYTYEAKNGNNKTVPIVEVSDK